MAKGPVGRAILCLGVGLVLAGCGPLDPARLFGVADKLNPYSWPRASRTHFVKTRDGWTLALEHWAPKGTLRYGAPVVLAHGFGYNGAFWSVRGDGGLAGYLARAGFDVWVLNWRGAGDSTKWAFRVPKLLEDMEVDGPEGLLERLRKLSRARLANVTTDPRYFSWSFDDHVREDMPAVLDYISRVTGRPRVLWVGHSMGGNVALAYLATHPEEAGRLLGLVTIGSQMTMPENRLFVEYLKALALRRKRAFEGIRGVGSALEALGEPAEELFYHRANVEAEVLKRLHEEASDAPGLGLIGQYLGLAQKGELKSSDGKLNYSRLMARVRPPVLLTAGARDRLAPPVVQRHLLRSLGSAEKRLVIFGRKEGFSTDYGHGDPIVGRRALGEIYPLIRDWLRDRAG